METKHDKGRRKFILTSIQSTALIGVSIPTISGIISSCGNSKKISIPSFRTGFDQQPLPYRYDALENVIDAQTMEIHYSKHAATYAKNLKEAAQAESVDMQKPLEDILGTISKYSAKMRNNAGGHYNHELFWKSMKPASKDNRPSGKLFAAIESTFGSFGRFKELFAESAKSRFGSGWAWLYADSAKKLQIESTPNQDNPLMDVSRISGFPLLGLDVWEHAYYLKYQNKRADYIENWWNVVNWDHIEQRYTAYIG
jgi:superoxide dismutase, Fe-Mn family